MSKEEEFYKTICEKFINTMEKEMILKEDKKILHIFIDDKFIKAKEAGKININNYEQYLDHDYYVSEYNSYQEMFDLGQIKSSINYDLNALDITNGTDKEWCFYLSFEELKKLGFEDKLLNILSNQEANKKEPLDLEDEEEL